MIKLSFHIRTTEIDPLLGLFTDFRTDFEEIKNITSIENLFELGKKLASKLGFQSGRQWNTTNRKKKININLGTFESLKTLHKWAYCYDFNVLTKDNPHFRAYIVLDEIIKELQRQYDNLADHLIYSLNNFQKN